MNVSAQALGDPIPWSTFLNFGILGIVFIMMLTGYMYPKPMIDYLRRENERLQGDNEKLRDENRELRTGIEEKVVPALVKTNDLMDKFVGVLASRSGEDR